MEKIGEVGTECERLGYDSLWMIDHVEMRPPIAVESQPIPDCWSTIAYLCEKTHTVKVGSLVSCVLLRDKEYLARITEAIQQISNGRLEVGIGSGWFDGEFRAYGIPFPDAKSRSDALESTSRYLRNYFDSMKPGDPRLWIGGSGEIRTLKTVAMYADACSLFGDPVTVARKIALLKEQQKSVSNRGQSNFYYSKHSNVVIGKNRAEVEKKLSRIISNTSKWAAFTANNIVGTVDECVEQTRRFIEAGVNYLTLSFPDLFEIEPIRLFHETVVKRFDQEIFA